MGKTIVVVGGGASGFMAAITAARAGAKVTILEQNNKLGKKILSTGNGRCNMTNLDQRADCYRSSFPGFAQNVLRIFSIENTMAFFKELGIFPKSRDGYIYPRSNQAASVVEALELEARRLKIKCKTQEEVVRIEKTEAGFSVLTKTWHYMCDSVILACGSKASVIEGSNGNGYQLAKNLGHKMVEPLPALVALKGKGNWFSKWAGVRCDAEVTLLIDDQRCLSDAGEVQLTDYGISGIPVFQISRFASRALFEKKRVSVKIDFLPDMTKQEIIQELNRLAEHNANKKIGQLLIGLIPSKLIDVLTGECKTIEQLAENIKNFSIQIKEPMDFAHAQVCTGGVACEEICSDTMESRLVPGIYFCGELIDVDGACGGYNLQWAWSSGYLAGISASKE